LNYFVTIRFPLQTTQKPNKNKVKWRKK